MSSSNHEDFEIQFYTKEYDNIVTKGLALKNEYDKIKILLMNAWYEQVKALNKASKNVYKIKEEKSIAVGHLDGFTPHLGLSRLGSRPHLGPTPGITRAQLSPPGDCEVIPGV
eukprot:2614921-Prymnesium_polylepis.2